MQNVYNLVQKHMRLHPGKIALSDGQTSWTYAELEREVTRWAGLIRQQVGKSPHVGIGSRRGPEAVIGILGIHQAGKTYVPIDEHMPEQRISSLLEQVELKYIIRQTCIGNLEARFDGLTGINDQQAPEPAVESERERLAYILFTSGSTGMPKGVEMPHMALENLITWQLENSRCKAGSRTLQFAPVSFDVSFQEIYATLSSGGTLYTIGEEERLDPRSLAEFLIRHRINRLFLPFVALQALAETLRELDVYPQDLQEIITAGEALKITSAIRMLASQIPGLSLFNQYGPTECHVVTQRALQGDPALWPDLPDIGYPISRVECLVLDAAGKEVAGDTPGELYLGGACLADGYLGDPEKTAAGFVHLQTRPEGLVRLYRTGDQVRRNPDGSLQFLGRLDQQVKLRGHRIELEAIELALTGITGIRQAAVVLQDPGAPGARLVAYLIGAAERPSHSDIRARLQDTLPDYMLPAKTVWMDAFPKTSSGKIDKKALPLPARVRPELDVVYQKGRNAMEEKIAAHWEALLQVSPVGIRDSFFDLGGDSLSAQKSVSFLSGLLNQTLPPTLLYQYPSIEGLLASLEQKAMPEEQSSPQHPTGKDIAVIGMALRFPGCSDPEAFWELLQQGRESIRFFSDEELDAGIDPELRADPLYVKARGVLEDAEAFDAAFFGIPPALAQVMDPQQRLFLELSRDALETSGYLPFRYSGRIGVFGGCGNNSYYQQVRSDPAAMDRVGEFQAMCVNEKDYIASRTAYHLDLSGPAVSLYTACSTSAAAVAMAVDQLRLGRCDLALAGAVSITVPLHSGHLYQEGAMLSRDGHCRPFDAGANGTVFSDGGAVLLLKDARQARLDGDHIFGIIKGVAMNNDGRDKGSFTAPNPRGQAGVLLAAWQDAGIRGDALQYVETHGTATPLGDPLEIEGLVSAFGKSGVQARCSLGSVKSNFGHLTAAAGAAGIIKTLLALHHAQIPPTLHFNTLNPHIDFRGHQIDIPDKLTPWPSVPCRMAGVSSFGVGGTNVHLVLQAGEARKDLPENRQAWLIPWSSRREASQALFAGKLARYVKGHADFSMRDLAYSLQAGREPFAFRDFLVAADREELLEQLEAFSLQNHLPARPEPPPLVFVFPGQGTQYYGMGQALYHTNPVFREAFDRCAESMLTPLKADIREIVFSGDHTDERLNRTLYTQPALFAHGYALHSLWSDLGLKPAAYMGHSVGELLAAHLAGVFGFEDAIAFLCMRARLMEQLPPGRMLAVRATPESESEYLLQAACTLAVRNAPSGFVASGSEDAIEQYARQLKTRGVPCKLLGARHAFHSPDLQAILPGIREFLQTLKRRRPHTPLYSTVTGTVLSGREATDIAYWTRQLRDPVRFSDAGVAALRDLKPLFVELGPDGTCTQYLRQHGEGFRNRCFASFPHGGSRDEHRQYLHSAGSLWQAGCTLRWEAWHAGKGSGINPLLPAYAYLKKTHWVAGKPGAIPSPAGKDLAAEPPAVYEQTNTTHMNTIRIEELQTMLEQISGLELRHADPTHSFIDLGMDSLLLTQIATRLKQHYQVPLTYRQLNEEQNSLSSLSAYLQAQGKGGDNGAGTSPSPLPVPVATCIPQGKQAEVSSEKTFGARPQIRQDRGNLNEKQAGFLKRFTDAYNRKTARSKAYAQQQRAHMADPRVVAGFRPETKELVYPLLVQRSEGSRLWDADGNAYIDVLNGFGSNLFGYQPGFIRRALHDQIERGFELGPQHPLSGTVCAAICRLTGQDRAALCNTGSEAVLGALRIARTCTGRDPVIAFKGSYHGINDEVIVRGQGPGKSQPAAPGIPVSAVENLWVLDYGTKESLEIIRAHAHQAAAILVEPVQSRRLDHQPLEFLKELREISRQSGALLIFDEVITGFRAHPGGVQALWNIRADLSTYGKVIGGGMPIGVIAGKAEYMDALDGGHWKYEDDSVPEAGVTYFAGTFVRHPLTLAAAQAALDHLEQQGADFQERLNEETRFLCDRMNMIIEDLGVPLKVSRFSSVWRIESTEDYVLPELLYTVMREKGIHIQDRFPCFLTSAHTRADILAIAEAFRDTLHTLVEAELIPSSIPAPETLLESFALNRPPLAGARLGKDPEGNPAWYVRDPDNHDQYLKVEL